MKLKVYITALVFLGQLSLGFAQGTGEFFTKADAFFKKHVNNGRVDYKAIKADPAELQMLLQMAENIKVTADNASEYQAFWINGYNLSVIQGIVNNYPVKQPLDISGFFDKKQYSIGGTQTTLNAIENQLLREVYPKEARFHFVLVCAGLGCPPIINEAYIPSKLDAQMEKQTIAALNDPAFIQVNKKKVKISQIFEWYKGDFEHEGSVTDYINTYRKEKLPENAKVSYYPYNWTLNDSQ